MSTPQPSCQENWRPSPLPGYDDDRKRRWDPDAVLSFPRAGQGHRTDLQTPAPTPPTTPDAPEGPR